MSNNIEHFCSMCRRPESTCGKLVHLPNDIHICSDCMQNTLDSMANMGFNWGVPGFGDPTKSGDNKPSKTDADSIDDSGDGAEPKDGGNDNVDMSQFKNISVFNLGDLAGGFFGPGGFMPGMNNPVKKKKAKAKAKEEVEGEEEYPVIDIKNIPPPHEIKAKLDEHVVGQEYAKKVMSVAVYNHYKRIASMDEENFVDDGVEIEKSNMLMIGPTGSGKTYMVRTLAKLLDVPLAITDATSLTEAGYIGDDIESVVSKLLTNADNDVDRAETGIIFIDEIDKLAKKRNTNSRDVSGESVQQGMLKLLEGAEIEVPVGASSKSAMVPMTTIDTSNILFICGGAFPDLEDIIKERLNKSSSMGFVSDLKDKYDKEENILTKVEVEDIRKFGMIPEFIGRLPIIFALEALTEEMYVRILTEPKNAITKQYQKLLSFDEVGLEFEEDALYTIAKMAKERELGARALRSIIEEIMLDIMFEIPKDRNIGKVNITKDYIEKKGGPAITIRDHALIAKEEDKE